MPRPTACPILFLLVAFLAGCKTNPSTGRNQLLLIPPEQTRQMGIEAMPQLVGEYGGEYPSAPLRAYVDRVGRDLMINVEEEYLQEPWEFTLLNSDVINAFALPGGKVFITVELLSRMDNEAQLAGVLGHEIGHVTALHVDERISRQVAFEFGLSAAGLATESQLILVGAQLFGNGYLLHFGRDQELEADSQGMKYMTRAMYDPAGMRQVMQILAEASSGSSTPEFLSTHPHPESRIRQINQLLRSTYAGTQGNPAYGMYADRFQSEAVPHFPARGGQAASLQPVDYCLHCRISRAAAAFSSAGMPGAP